MLSVLALVTVIKKCTDDQLTISKWSMNEYAGKTTYRVKHLSKMMQLSCFLEAKSR